MMRQQPMRLPPSMRTLLAAVDGVVDEAVENVLREMRGRHTTWHTEMKSEPSGGGCHTCVLLGMAQEEASEPKGKAKTKQ